MAYFGHQTGKNFVAWIIFWVCLVTGAIWLGIGGAGYVGCNYCEDQFSYQGKTNITSWATNVTAAYGLDRGCMAAGYEFMLWYPVDATQADATSDFHSWCINSGPIAGLVAGGVVMLAALLALLYFFVASPPPAGSGMAVTVKA